MSVQPPVPVNVTIIKRKKIVKGEGHHGGAWKVAYADFVTAMMASSFSCGC
ncbi:MAG: flagellar motor protein MotB [Hyphomonas sp.]